MVKDRYFCLVVLCTFITACNTPGLVYENTVGVSLTGEQTPARIQFSEAKINAREALVNDRSEEVRFIKELLAKSDKETFTSQLQRDIQQISILSAQFGIGFDSGVASQNQQIEERKDILHQIEKTKLEAELLRVEEALKEFKSGTGEGPGKPSTELSEEFKSVDFEDAAEDLSGLITNVKELLNVGEAVRTNDITLSPIEKFRAIRAYRDELRSALASERLDDSHDLNGNGLFRLSLTANILPGEHKDRYGIAVIDVLPTKFDQDKLVKLYYDWLQHVTTRLNNCSIEQIDGEVKNVLKADLHYERMGHTSDFFRIVKLNNSEGEDRRGESELWIAVHPAAKILIDYIVAKKTIPGEFKVKEIHQILRGLVNYEEGDSANLENKRDAIVEELFGEKYKSIIKDAIENLKDSPKAQAETLDLSNIPERGTIYNIIRKKLVLGAWASIESASKGIANISDLNDCKSLISTAIEGQRAALRVFDEEREHYVLISDEEKEVTPLNKAFQPTMSFDKFLTAGFGECWAGESFAYTTAPFEKSQRVSTVAGAANAAQIALGLKAADPTSGISASAGFNSLRGASGKVNALERVPLVIGFEDSSSRDDCTLLSISKANSTIEGNESTNKEFEITNQLFRTARFGWIFGPPARLDVENRKLLLEHVVTKIPLHSEISLPAWWRDVRLEVRTAWVGENWLRNNDPLSIMNRYIDVHGTEQCDETKGGVAFCKVINPKFVDTDPSWESLTDYLAENYLLKRGRKPSITAIRPREVSRCAKEVNLQITGLELWRGTEAFLHTQSSKEFRVLPSMQGVTAKFNLKDLNTTQKELGLTIWTKDGAAQDKVLVNSDGCDKKPTDAINEPVEDMINLSSASYKNGVLKVEYAAGRKVAEKYPEYQMISLNMEDIDGSFSSTFEGKPVGPEIIRDITIKYNESNKTITSKYTIPDTKFTNFCRAIKEGKGQLIAWFVNDNKKRPPLASKPITIKGSCLQN